MMVFEILLVCVSLLILLPVSVFFAQVLLAMLPRRPAQSDGYRPTVAVLMPAHNEASIITETLTALLPQLQVGDRLIVVADNCSDQTASLAADLGVEVVERNDLSRRGKGYALDFGIRQLSATPPETVIIIDADCIVHEGAIDRLARLSMQLKRPVQALYLMRSPTDSGLKTQIAEFAWLVKNHVRPMGFLQLDMPCQLMGTGMAFPWQVISGARLASGHIVEDLKLGIDLACLGSFPVFCPEALVTSCFPSSHDVIKNQRTRWEHGHIDVILTEFPRLLAAAVSRRSMGLLALALDLCVPPLALLSLSILAVALASLLFYVVYSIALPFFFSVSALLMLSSAIYLSWLKYGRQVIPFPGLIRVPSYILWKIPLYLKYLIKKEGAWVKTKR